VKLVSCCLPLLLAPALACSSETACGDDQTNCIADPTGDSESGETGEPIELDPACLVDEPIVVLETNYGDMVVQLEATTVPITVTNFLTYVDTGFYDGTIFHRVVQDFIIQGGGYQPGLVAKETMGPIPLEIDPSLHTWNGVIAMARREGPDTAESEFFICDGPQFNLDQKFAAFGVLIDGLEVRDAIADVPVQAVDAEFTHVPVEDVILERAYCVDSWP
jgi:cyclophilin family peptidyl-prolyl cis-trans isomerase